MATPDLTYKKSGLFTLFMPETSAGHVAWAAIAKRTEGTGKVFTIHLDQTLRQLRKAGYSVAENKQRAENIGISDDELLTKLLDIT
jgi:hypothetical protein